MLRSVRLSPLSSVTKTRNRNIVTVYGERQAIMENPGTDPGPKGTPHAAQETRLGTLRSVPLHAQGRSRFGEGQHLVVELEAGGPRLMVADVPPIGLLQPYLERGQLHLEDARHFANVLGDRRQVVVLAEVEG